MDDKAFLISYEEYHPYGTTSYHSMRSGIEVSHKRYRYTAKERDEETGLNYYGARYYALWLGRWTNGDPKGLIDGVNVYHYALNNPVGLSDYSGTQTVGFKDFNLQDKLKLNTTFPDLPTPPGLRSLNSLASTKKVHNFNLPNTFKLAPDYLFFVKPKKALEVLGPTLFELIQTLYEEHRELTTKYEGIYNIKLKSEQPSSDKDIQEKEGILIKWKGTLKKIKKGGIKASKEFKNVRRVLKEEVIKNKDLLRVLVGGGAAFFVTSILAGYGPGWAAVSKQSKRIPVIPIASNLSWRIFEAGSGITKNRVVKIKTWMYYQHTKKLQLGLSVNFRKEPGTRLRNYQINTQIQLRINF